MSELDNDETPVYRDRFYDITTQPSRMLPPIQGYQDQPLVSLEDAIEPLIGTVDDIEKKVEEAKRDTESPPADHLNTDESASIRLYTMEWENKERSLYCVLNNSLRSEDRTLLKKWFRYLRLLIHALLKISPTTGKIFRGVNMNLLESYKQGNTATWWAFSSCTTTPKVLKTEAFLPKSGDRTRFEINSYSGRNIHKHSSFPNENEVLLLAASHFRIKSCHKAFNGLCLVTMEEIEPPFMLLEKPEVFSQLDTDIFLNIPEQKKIMQQNKQLVNLIRRRPPHSTIDLNGLRLTDQDMQLIVDLALVEKQCTKLSLRNVNIGSCSISILASGLQDSQLLEELDLSESGLSDTDVISLVNAFKEQEISVTSRWACFRIRRTIVSHTAPLRKLYLTDNNITDTGIHYLTNLIRSKATLIELWLGNNRISNQGIELFASVLILPSTTLERLYLNNNILIDDTCLDALRNILENNQSLKSLSLTNCNLRTTSKEELKSISSKKDDFVLLI